MRYVKVGVREGEKAKRELMAKDAYDGGRKIEREGDCLFLPVLAGVSLPGFECVEREREPVDLRPRSLVDALSGVLSSEELSLVPRSFDVIGDVAVMELPEGLAAKEKVVGEALLSTFRNIKVATKKSSSIGSEYRTRQVEVVAGEDRTETVHREHGCSYKLDVSSAYFSPRLGTERLRVASQVRPNERVLVLFAGVGPYAILIAKKAGAKGVVAVELNPEGARYMKENVRLNKLGEEDVLAIEGDARTVTPTLGKFDRVVMPLPKDAVDFLDVVLLALNPGGVVNFYTFAQSTQEAKEYVRDACRRLGYDVEILASVECGTFSPQLSRMCVDFRIK